MKFKLRFILSIVLGIHIHIFSAQELKYLIPDREYSAYIADGEPLVTLKNNPSTGAYQDSIKIILIKGTKLGYGFYVKQTIRGNGDGYCGSGLDQVLEIVDMHNKISRTLIQRVISSCLIGSEDPKLFIEVDKNIKLTNLIRIGSGTYPGIVVYSRESLRDIFNEYPKTDSATFEIVSLYDLNGNLISEKWKPVH